MPAQVTRIPDALIFPAAKLHWPLVTLAAFGGDGVLVLAGQRTNRCAGVLFDANLASTKGVVPLGEGEAMDWQPRRLVALPDRRFLLCTLGRGGMSVENQNLFVDGATLQVSSAAALVGIAPPGRSNLSERDPSPRDVLFLEDRALIGHGAYYGNVDDYQSFSVLPASFRGEPLPWLHDLDEQLEGMAGVIHRHHHVVCGAALRDGLILASQSILRMGSGAHALIVVDPGGKVTARRPDDSKRIRDDRLQLEADRSRQQVFVYARGSLEVIDADLRTVAQAPAGHPFLKSFRLLAGDGQGRLLWSNARRKILLLSEPEDIRLDDLPSSLDALNARSP